MALAAISVLLGCGPEPDVETAAPAREPPALADPVPVGYRVETFVDDTRPTAAQGDSPETPTRTVPTVLFYPATGTLADEPVEDAPVDRRSAPYPLVVLSHGRSGSPFGYPALVASWVAAGYVVAAPDFPLTGADAPGGPNEQDLLNQPGDVSFVISELLAATAASDGPLAGLLDPARIAAAGHSLGAMTTLALGYHTCCADERIKAAAVFAGQQVPFGQGAFFTGAGPPLLLVHGTADESILYPEGRRAYADALPPKFLVSITDGDHSTPFVSPSQRADVAVVIAATTAMFDHYVNGDPGALARLWAAGDVTGVARIEGFES